MKLSNLVWIPGLMLSSALIAGCNGSSTADETDKEIKPVVSKVAEAPKAAAEAVKVATAAAVTSSTSTQAATTEAEEPAKVAVAAKPQYVEGQHYFEIFPEMQTDAPDGKVEVVELLWIGCPHCFALEPTMEEYMKEHPDYVAFKQVPAMLNPRWAGDARSFYMADLLDPDGEKKLIAKLFQAIHVQKRARMADPEVVKRFLMEQGISEADYDNAAGSMELNTRLQRARQISADSQAQSVPTVIINGKYRTSPYAAGNEKKLVEIINMLTKREHEGS